MTERASCWSITINNPTETDYQRPLPPSWKLEGQLERGDDTGTLHYQGMLRTPQVRFSAVKKEFPRAHIEVARNATALKKYVHKDDTREASVTSIPTLFEYQVIIAEKWDESEFQRRWRLRTESIGNNVPDPSDTAMGYVDSLVAQDIEEGMRGVEFIAINPMWRSSWLRFWRSIINRQKKFPAKSIIEDAPPPPPVQESEEI